MPSMGFSFGERLAQAREVAGLSGYRLVQLSGIAQGNLQAIERGRRPPSDANLAALAAVTELGVTLDQLEAWRDLDKIGGEGGLDRIKAYAPEALGDTIGAVISELPDEMQHPPQPRELKLLARIDGFDGSELDPRSGSQLWTFPPEKRWPALKQAEKDWRESNGLDEATGASEG